MGRDRFEDWIKRYERAWRTAGTDGLDELFSESASYSTAPFDRPFEGLAAISLMWEAEREGPDEEFELHSSLIAVDGDTAVARVEVRYGKPRECTYRDIWVIELDREGRCRRFEEWPFWPPGSGGTYLSGPTEDDAQGGESDA